MILLDTYPKSVLQNFKKISTNTFWIPYWYFEYSSKNMSLVLPHVVRRIGLHVPLFILWGLMVLQYILTLVREKIHLRSVYKERNIFDMGKRKICLHTFCYDHKYLFCNFLSSFINFALTYLGRISILSFNKFSIISVFVLYSTHFA